MKEGGFYNSLHNSINDLSSSGITHIWLPPPSQSVSPEGLILFLDFHGFNINKSFFLTKPLNYSLRVLTWKAIRSKQLQVRFGDGTEVFDRSAETERDQICG